MLHCPHCQSPATWLLADRRCKCKSCGARYSATSVWDSIRLRDSTKQALLRAFVDGRSAYRQRFELGACVDSRERFNRLVRACCALSESVDESAIHVATCPPPGKCAMRGWTSADSVLLVWLRENQSRISIAGSSPRSVDTLLALLSRRVALGGVYSMEDGSAVATLRVHAGYVVIGRTSGSALGAGVCDVFWNHTRQHLQPLRKISRAFIHLYLGEMCYRFNRRDSEVAADLRELLHSTAAVRARALLNYAKASAESLQLASAACVVHSGSGFQRDANA